MNNPKIYNELLVKLKSLYTGYATTCRASIQPYKYKSLGNNKSDLNEKTIRESLIEHIGFLPILATSVYPYIENKKVNLGDTLIMLAVHDIGETSLGDKMFFQKETLHSDDEKKASLSKLPNEYRKLYHEFTSRTSETSKFANSIDKIAPDILELLLDPKISHKRYKEQVGFAPKDIVKEKRIRKLPLMKWDTFLYSFYNYLLDKLEQHL